MEKPALVEQRSVRGLLSSFARFTHTESLSGVLLLIATAASLVLANSRFASAYASFTHLSMRVSLGRVSYDWTLRAGVNDALMAVFFLVVGLEIKREFVVGELASFRKAILPVFGALGGVLTPALIYGLLNGSRGSAGRGIGVPIATDIAFSLAILAVFGSRIPTGLKLFLVTLAIVDDIVGILVIATVYTRRLHPEFLAIAILLFLACLALNRFGVIRLGVYGLMGVALWLALSASGIQATVAGIALALAIPSRSLIHPRQFLGFGKARMSRLAQATANPDPLNRRSREILRTLRQDIALVESPLDRMQAHLHPWVSFGIVPLFAFTNAGISLHRFHVRTALDPIFMGIVLGLVLGKPLGITAFSWLAVRCGMAELPAEVRWMQLHAVSWLGGIGFTVSLFIAGLAFDSTEQSAVARMAVLMASAVAAAAGAAMLAITHRR